MEEIRYFNNDCWNKEKKAVLNLCSQISENMNIISNSVENNCERQILAAFANRIKKEFTENLDAVNTATNISYHVNKYYFSFSDPVKHIFSYLIPKKNENNYQHLKLVSKAFNCNANYVRQQWINGNPISLHLLGLESLDEAIEYIQFHHLKKINLCHFPKVNQSYLEKLAAQNIHTLVVCCQKKDIKKWPKMESLKSIHLLETNDKLLIEMAKGCPSITKLNLSGNNTTWVTDTGLIGLAKACSNLTSVDLKHSLITDVGLIELAKCCPNINKIDLYNTDISDAGIIELAKNCPNITEIKFRSKEITDRGLIELAKNCSNITEIDLGSENITDRGLIELAKCCPNITKINLAPTGVTSRGLIELTKGCPKLISIKLSHKIYGGLKELGEGCQELKEINLSFTGISEFEFLPFSRFCKSLETLNVSFSQITDRGLCYIVEANPNLKKIDLSETCITDESLNKIAKKCPGLKTINLSNTKITDSGLIQLAKSCPELTSIDLCPTNISDLGFLELLKVCPKLDIVQFNGKFLRGKKLVEYEKKLIADIKKTKKLIDEINSKDESLNKKIC